MSYQGFVIQQAQNQSYLAPAARVGITFELQRQQLAYVTVNAMRYSSLQLASLVLSSLVSLFSIYVIVFVGSEWIFKRMGWTLGHIQHTDTALLQAGSISTRPKSVDSLDDASVHAQASSSVDSRDVELVVLDNSSSSHLSQRNHVDKEVLL